MASRTANAHTRLPSHRTLASVVDKLVSASLSKSSQAAYKRHWARLDSFIDNYFKDHEWPHGPVTNQIMAAFIAYLYKCNYSPATILSNVSAISYIHKIQGWNDPADSFIIKKILVGAKNLSGTVDTRLPVTLDMLTKLCRSVKHVVKSQYMSCALQAMFSLAFFALLRVGEFTVKKQASKEEQDVLHVSDIKFQGHKNNKKMFITIRKYKHNKSQRPITLQLEKQTGQVCPIKHMTLYLAHRKNNTKPLFVFPDGASITRAFFSRNLKQCIELAGFDSSRVKAHSLRVGGATQAAMLGFSDTQIQAMGRWKSDAYKKYIRIPALNTC